ncbi:MAG: DUF3147 family protein [Acidobacteriia bacterium]|nr:DUF3147 family protein [Terriglobia bacterium]
MDLVLRFIIGGLVVSAFATLGDLLKPRSFAGLFGAAPSVALATLALTMHREGAGYASIECRSMLIGAIALGLYAWAVCRVMVRRRVEPLRATLYDMGVWFAAAFSLWMTVLR